VLQYHFNWKVLSALAGITWWNFYFRLYEDTIRAPQVVDFLAHLLRHLPGRLLVIWEKWAAALLHKASRNNIYLLHSASDALRRISFF
jgi:hypothetical protein